MSSDEIEGALGIEYDKCLDMSSGIIFVKNKKIVYEERFIEKYDAVEPQQSNFIVHSYKNNNNKPKVKIFTRDDVFECYRYRLVAK